MDVEGDFVSLYQGQGQVRQMTRCDSQCRKMKCNGWHSLGLCLDWLLQLSPYLSHHQ